MLNLPLYDIDLVKPSNFQEVIVTNGFTYRSGVWITLPNGSEGFLVDPEDSFDIYYWIPTPQIND